MPEISFVHLVYLAFVAAILALIYYRKDTVLVSLIGLFTIGVFAKGSIVGGLQGVFNSIAYSASQMLIIPILIGVIFALSQMMKHSGAAYLMVAPFRKILGKPGPSFWILGILMFVMSLFFWPTPAAGLIGAILVPVAVGAGLPALTAASAIAMFGHGGALSGDWVLQGAPTIMAKASGVPVPDLLHYATLIVGPALLIGALVAYFMNAKGMGKEVGEQQAKAEVPTFSPHAKFAAIFVPIVFALDIAIMISQKLIGGDATALLGGSVLLMMVVIAIVEYGKEALDKLVNYLKSGFVFSFEVFTPVFVIAAYFFMGAPEGAEAIFGKGSHGYMVEVGQYVAMVGGVNKVVLAIIQVLVGAAAGLDGAGFSPLPLLGSLAQSLAPTIGAKVAPLAVLGQMAAIWTAGALVPWGFMAALAAFCEVSPIELARKNFIPSMAAFATATIIAILLM